MYADRAGDYAAVFVALAGAAFGLYGAAHGLSTPAWVCLFTASPLAVVWLLWKLEDKLTTVGTTHRDLDMLATFETYVWRTAEVSGV